MRDWSCSHSWYDASCSVTQLGPVRYNSLCWQYINQYWTWFINIWVHYAWVLQTCFISQSACVCLCLCLCVCACVWLNSSVLFTWEINSRPYDGHYPPTDTWANTRILYEHKPVGRTCTWTNTGSICLLAREDKHAWRARARCTYLHTLIENRADLFSHVSSKHYIYAYFLTWATQTRQGMHMQFKFYCIN